MVDVVKEYVGVDFWNVIFDEEVCELVKKYNVLVMEYMIYGYIFNEFFEIYVEEKFI